MDIEQARYNMVEQQIRPWNVLDQHVLDLVYRTPREAFVPEPYAALAFSDTCIPLGEGEVMMTPQVEARMLQALAISPGDNALEIGTGSGYVTALLARSCRVISSIEISKPLSERARVCLAQHDIDNVTLEVGDGAGAWIKSAPYDVIAVTGSLPVLDTRFQEQLKVGGRLFVIVGVDAPMEALLVTRVAEGEWTTESLFETSLPALRNAGRPDRFVF